MKARVTAVLALTLVAGGCADRSFDFAVIGDLPYGEEGWRLFPNVVVSLNAADVEWVLNIGDIKSGGTPCSDSLIRARFEAFQEIVHPLVYTPGDNEWTDCHRPSAGAYDPLERLGFLRGVFYPQPGRSLGGAPMEVSAQAGDGISPGFPEHQRWVRNGVVFLTVHVVGSDNGMAPFEGRTDRDDAEVATREAAAIEWIRTGFEIARRDSAAAVVVAFHADPYFPNPVASDGVGASANAGDAYREILATITGETLAFRRPVLLIHGDTHYFRIDKPLYNPVTNRRIDNFTRLETFGAPDLHWVRVHVDPGDRDVFGFDIELIPENLGGYD